MSNKNDVTGDTIKSKGFSKDFENNYDKIFRNKLKTSKPNQCPNAESSTGCYCTGACKKDWDEKRVDTIGQNGNEGLHYQLNKDNPLRSPYLEDDYARVEHDYQEK